MKRRPFASLILCLIFCLLAAPVFASVPLWELSPGDRPYLDTTTSQRTVAHNPVTGNIYVISSMGAVPGRIFILDAATGADRGELSMAGVVSGANPMIEVAVAQDGTIYATNITLAPATDPFRIYRWANESAQPELVYMGDPTNGAANSGVNGRWGKNMALRGTKDAIEILVISAGSIGAFFTGGDTLTATTFTDLPGYRLERGLAWGDGDTFYANHSLVERGLHHFSLNKAAGTTELLAIYDGTVLPHLIGPIMVDTKSRILGGIQVGATGVRQYAAFYDLDSLSTTFPNTAFLSVPFTARGSNATGYGGMAYGNGRAFAVNTRSGILAVELPAATPGMEIEHFARTGQNNLEFSVRSRLPLQGVTHQLEGSPSLEQGSWSPVAAADWVQPLLGGQALVRVPMPAEGRYFYRLAASRVGGASFFEDFESGGPGWTSGGENNSWEIGVPTSGPGTAVSGQNVAATNLSGNYPANSNAWLRSPTIDLRGVTSASLSFSEYVDVDDYMTFHGTVVSVLDAGTLQELEELSRVNVRNTGWRTRELTLSAASLGKEVVIQFRLFSDDLNLLPGWYLDNVAVGSPSVLLVPEYTTSLSSLTVNGSAATRAGNHFTVDLSGASSVEIVARATDPGSLVLVNGVPLGADGTFTYDRSQGVPATLTIEVVGRDGENMETYTLEIDDTASVVLWEQVAGDYPYLRTSGNMERSVAYNHTTGNVYVSSAVVESGVVVGRVVILNGTTGAEIGQLSMTGVSGGDWALCDIDVASDGTIYGANLTLTPAYPGDKPFKIYRWLNESAQPELIYEGDPTGGAVASGVDARWGKNMAVRGTKDAIEVLVVTAGTYAGLFTGSDSLTVTLFTDLAGTRPERGVAFGAGDTFFRKHARAGDRELREFSFDRVAGTTQLLRAFPTSVFSNMIGPIYVDLERRILGAIKCADVGVTQFAEFYHLDSLSTTTANVPYLVVPFSSTNNSRDGYGDITFGNGRAWALNTNNGLLAIELPDPE
jgi:hypothetical protein